MSTTWLLWNAMDHADRVLSSAIAARGLARIRLESADQDVQDAEKHFYKMSAAYTAECATKAAKETS